MTPPQTTSEAKYTYADYLSWDDQGRWELINGEVWDMSLAPSRIHQEISIRISSLLYDFFSKKDCAVYAAPFDVRLPEEGKVEAFDRDDVLGSPLFEGLEIRLTEIFLGE